MSITIRFLRERGDLRWRAIECVLVFVIFVKNIRDIIKSESRERSIQTIIKVSSKSLNYLPIFFSNSMVDRKVDSNLWKNLRADFIYLHFNLHQWLVYKTSVISTSYVTIQGTCWDWKYLSRFYCEEIMNIDFDEDKRKLPTKSFLKYSRELSTYP